MSVAILPNASAQARAKAVAAATTIDGWLTSLEAGKLYDLAKAATGPIVEIGTWQGRSTAALALGSMAGGKQQVWAVDSFEGVPPSDRPSCHGVQPGWKSSTPFLVRENLDNAGVNGLVTILPVSSRQAHKYLPESIGLLFVDGGHDYETVKADLTEYLPRVQEGGHVVIHDCWELDPDVVKAVDDSVFREPQAWRIKGRIDSALIVERRTSQRHKVLLGFPGRSMLWGTSRGLMTASLGAHEITCVQSGTGWDDMNILWVRALNAARQGKITHFAMLHSDVVPGPGWVDTLIAELGDHGCDLVSSVVPIKDQRGLTSTGIGDHANPWQAFRRLTMHEVHALPETFGIEDTPHPDKYLLHNTGCWCADLRRQVFFAVDENKRLRATFNFPLGALEHEDGSIEHLRESEDWHFSRQLALLGAKTKATRKVSLTHDGDMSFTNTHPWGSSKCDHDTAAKWNTDA